MKTPLKVLITELTLLTLVSAFSLQPLALLAQGSLTPPGAPAPTMKSLDEIYAKIGTSDPRTVVNAANTPGDSGNSFIISQPGSYYLTTNLAGVSGKNGIEIATNNVTLDLNGFVLQGVSGSQNGINFPGGLTNVTVRNGTVSGWGNIGVCSAYGFSAANVVFERLTVSANNNNGIENLGAGCVVRDCNSQNNSGAGIECGGGIVSGCTANNNSYTGITADACIVSGCTANNNGYSGIAINPGTVSGCFVSQNKYNGIDMYSSGSEVIGNTCIGNNTGNYSGFAGIYIEGSTNRVENNHVTASSYAGILVYSYSGYINNIIIKNSVSGNGANNYVTPNTQIVGPIINTTGTITNSNPWANFSF